MYLDPTTPTTPPTLSAVEQIEQMQAAETGDMTADQAKTMEQWIREDAARGKVSPEAAQKIFDELGTPPADRVDHRTPGAKELDAQGFVPAKPEDFLLPFDDQVMPPAAKQATRAWLTGAEADRTAGNTFIKTVDEIGRQLGKMSEAQKIEYPGQQMALLKQQFGDSLDARFAQARELINILEAQTPGLKAMLQSGPGDSARIVAQIFALSERWHARRTGKPLA